MLIRLIIFSFYFFATPSDEYIQFCVQVARKREVQEKVQMRIKGQNDLAL